jgi:hypothetical protein
VAQGVAPTVRFMQTPTADELTTYRSIRRAIALLTRAWQHEVENSYPRDREHDFAQKTVDEMYIATVRR